MTYICRHIVLIRVTLAVMRHHDQNQIGEDRVYLTLTSTLLFITGGARKGTQAGPTWRQELIQGKGEMLLIDLFLVPVVLASPNAHVLIYYMCI